MRKLDRWMQGIGCVRRTCRIGAEFGCQASVSAGSKNGTLTLSVAREHGQVVERTYRAQALLRAAPEGRRVLRGSPMCLHYARS